MLLITNALEVTLKKDCNETTELHSKSLVIRETSQDKGQWKEECLLKEVCPPHKPKLVTPEQEFMNSVVSGSLYSLKLKTAFVYMGFI